MIMKNGKKLKYMPKTAILKNGDVFNNLLCFDAQELSSHFQL